MHKKKTAPRDDNKCNEKMKRDNKCNRSLYFACTLGKTIWERNKKAPATHRMRYLYAPDPMNWCGLGPHGLSVCNDCIILHDYTHALFIFLAMNE